jgi:hypothetical protein
MMWTPIFQRNITACRPMNCRPAPTNDERPGTRTRSGVPRGIRTPVAAVKGRCPRPLDDGDVATRVLPAKHVGLNGGARRDRTADLYNAIVALSQLSYGPTRNQAVKSRERRDEGQPEAERASM